VAQPFSAIRRLENTPRVPGGFMSSVPKAALPCSQGKLWLRWKRHTSPTRVAIQPLIAVKPRSGYGPNAPTCSRRWVSGDVCCLAGGRDCISQNHRITESLWLEMTLKITESQNSRGWKGSLWVIQSNPPAKAGSPRAGCTGACPGGA